MATQKSPRASGTYHSPRRDSPRRRIIDMHPLEFELEQAMNKLRLQDVEKRKMHAQERKMHHEGIDRLDNTLYQETRLALEQAQQNRETLRKEAEACLEKWIKEQEEERRRKQEIERLKREREAQERAARDLKLRQEQQRLEKERQETLRKEQELKERERQEKEEKERLTAETKQKAIERQKQEEERQRQDEERVRQQSEQTRLEAEAREKQAQQQEQQQQKITAAASAAREVPTSDQKNILDEHAEYLELYGRIKKWKNDYWANVMEKARGNDPNKRFQYPEIKERAGELKRTMRGINVLTASDKEMNRIKTNQIREAIRESLSIKTPHIGRDIPVNHFLPASLQLNDNNQATLTDLAAYALSCFVQATCKVFMESAPTQPENAEPVGTFLMTVFAMPELQFQRTTASGTAETQTLFPMFLAKYHKVCPILFGITGNETTVKGKIAIGWQAVKNEDGSRNSFVSENTHYDRQIGLAVGFSSFGLRNFSVSSAMRNPYPPIHFWRSLAMIINLPPEEVQPTHLCVLKNIFGKEGMRRFLLFFGAVGMVVIREAYIHFPDRLPDGLKANILWKESWVYARDKLREDSDLTLEFQG